MLSCYNLHLLQASFECLKDCQGFYIFEVPQENVKKAFISVIILEVGVQMVTYQGIKLCKIEGFFS